MYLSWSSIYNNVFGKKEVGVDEKVAKVLYDTTETIHGFIERAKDDLYPFLTKEAIHFYLVKNKWEEDRKLNHLHLEQICNDLIPADVFLIKEDDSDYKAERYNLAIIKRG